VAWPSACRPCPSRFSRRGRGQGAPRDCLTVISGSSGEEFSGGPTGSFNR